MGNSILTFITTPIENLQRHIHYTDFASGFDSFEYAQIHNDPGNQEIAKEFPAEATNFFKATGFF